MEGLGFEVWRVWGLGLRILIGRQRLATGTAASTFPRIPVLSKGLVGVKSLRPQMFVLGHKSGLGGPFNMSIGYRV